MSSGVATGPVRSWLQLVRLPAVFTALADIAAGFACKRGSFEPVSELASLMTASAALYLAGMVLNDVFDRNRDAAERPGRPIPGGRISVRAAIILAFVLVAVGIGFASSVSRQALLISVGLAVCIFAYDGLLKTTLLGPVAMGGCRFLNVMLGAATDDVAAFVWAPPQTFVAVAIGIYVAGVTWFARTESKQSFRPALVGGGVLAGLGIAILAGSYRGQPAALAVNWRGGIDSTTLLILVFAIAFTIGRRMLQAVAEPTPERVQAAVKLMLLSIITLDATVVLASTGSFMLAIGTALLVVPALILGRWVYVT